MWIIIKSSMRNFLSVLLILVVMVFGVQAWADEAASPSPSPTHMGKDKELREEKKAEFKQELRRIKDSKKKNAVSKIAEGLAKLNSERLRQFGHSLDRLEKVLNQVLHKAEKRAQKGFNVEKVKMAAEEARVAIAASRAAIEVQKGKVYKIEASSEEDLKGAVKKTRQALQNDLKAVQDTVKVAREAVKKATVSLARIKQEGRATPPPSLSPSPMMPSPSNNPSPN